MGVNLQQVLAGFLTTRETFPLNLGLPLTLARLRKIDHQSFIDKTTSNHAHWQTKAWFSWRIFLKNYIVALLLLFDN